MATDAKRYLYWRREGIIVGLHSDTGDATVLDGEELDAYTDDLIEEEEEE